jgi:hypothetical protein
MAPRPANPTRVIGADYQAQYFQALAPQRKTPPKAAASVELLRRK